MNALYTIYIIGAFAIGLLSGMILELFLEARTIRELQDDNRRLREQNNHLKQNQKVEFYEIYTKTPAPGNEVDYSWTNYTQKR